VLLRSRKRGRYDGICFHAQQCAEKYLKAKMVEAGKPFSKTHDLEVLLNLAMTIEPLWGCLQWK
jgi:HEPN domain-containing protein